MRETPRVGDRTVRRRIQPFVTNRGITIAEFILAMFLLLLLILGVVSLFVAMLGASSKSNNQAAGVMFAERILERLAVAGRKTYPAYDVTMTGGSEGFYTGDPANPTTFFYAVTASEVTPAENANPNSAGQTWLLETQVSWWSDSTSTRAGQGRLFVRQARLVYIPR